MERLQELERKVQKIVQINKDLSVRASSLEEENNSLKNTITQLEARIAHESSSIGAFAQEKDAMRATIDDLISSIDELQLNQG